RGEFPRPPLFAAYLDGNVYSIYFVKRDGRAAVEWKEAASGRL
ncbi:hypothetical protein HMPREF0372_02037, partial [Flavonifractor plautii ATCC 29863]